MLLEKTPVVQPGRLPFEAKATPSAEVGRDLNLRAVLAAEEKRTLIEALARASGVRRDAARLLGIDARNLGYFLRKHGLEKREDE